MKPPWFWFTGGFLPEQVESNDKFQFLPVENQAVVEGLAEKPADGFPAPFAVIERPVVHVHPDKFVGEVAAHVASELQRVLHRLGAVIQTELNARGQNTGNFPAKFRRKFLVNDVSAQRQWQAIVLFAPPNAQIFANDKVFVFIRQLAFVDDKADVRPAGTNGLKNPVEGHDDVIEAWSSGSGLPGSQSCNARNALVNVPGTAIFFLEISSRVNFCPATSIGP